MSNEDTSQLWPRDDRLRRRTNGDEDVMDTRGRLLQMSANLKQIYDKLDSLTKGLIHKGKFALVCKSTLAVVTLQLFRIHKCTFFL